jgi:hypothetical protein
MNMEDLYLPFLLVCVAIRDSCPSTRKTYFPCLIYYQTRGEPKVRMRYILIPASKGAAGEIKR